MSRPPIRYRCRCASDSLLAFHLKFYCPKTNKWPINVSSFTEHDGCPRQVWARIYERCLQEPRHAARHSKFVPARSVPPPGDGTVLRPDACVGADGSRRVDSSVPVAQSQGGVHLPVPHRHFVSSVLLHAGAHHGESHYVRCVW